MGKGRILLRLWLAASALWVAALGIGLWPTLFPTSDRFVEFAQGRTRDDDRTLAVCDVITLTEVRAECRAFYRDRQSRRARAAAVILAPPILAFAAGVAALWVAGSRMRRHR